VEQVARGAAWVFTRAGGIWTQQAKIVPADEDGYGTFGASVAMSADGNTVLVGAPQDGYIGPNHPENSYHGAAWVYTRAGGIWTEQAKLLGTAELDPGFFGTSVALSADGATALVGGLGDNADVGAAWAFRRTGTTWAADGGKLTGGNASGAPQFGQAVALSGDGHTALVAGPFDNGNAGAVWTFTDTGGSWVQQGPKLTGPQPSGCQATTPAFGTGVSLSGDGATALIGGAGDQSCKGGAWVYARSGDGWIQPSTLSPNDEVGLGQFGWSTALTPDAQHAVLGGWNDAGGAGAAWLFSRSGGGWIQASSKLTAGSPGDQLGYAVALSADALTVLTGANGAFANAGRTWAFTTPPVVASVSPASGPSDGGTAVTITGSQLDGAPRVEFGQTAAKSVTPVSPTEVRAISPAGAPGVTDVTVTTDRGTSSPTPASQFTYVLTRPQPAAPKLSRVRESHRRWRGGPALARLAGRARTPVGTVFSFRLNRFASVTLTFTRQRRHRVAGKLKVAAAAGANRLHFAGRLGRRRRLSPGSYTVAFTATDAAGRASKAAHLTFTIVPG
jgi:hypothetical protein